MMLKKNMFDKLSVKCIIESLKHIFFKNIAMFTFVETYTFDSLEILSLKK